MSPEPTLTCGWCPTPIPSLAEVQHHFFVAHGQATSSSVRFHYPDEFEREFNPAPAAGRVFSLIADAVESSGPPPEGDRP